MQQKTQPWALVIDDDPALLALVARAMRGEGFVCETAEDGEVATKKLSARRYDVVVVDLRMPKLHGHAVAVELLKSSPGTMIVVLTGLIEPKLARDLIARGVEDIVFKPTDPFVFAAKAKALLQRCHDRKEREEEKEGEIARARADSEETVGRLSEHETEIEESYTGSVRMLASLIEQMGRMQGSHAVRVEETAEGVAVLAGIEGSELRNVKVASLLHDIGQFGLPDPVRSRPPWELSPEERKTYEKYPTIGVVLLSEVCGSKPLIEIVESHAENFDGTGFPHRKRGSEVSLAARVLRLADGLDTYLLFTNQIEHWEAARRHLARMRGSAYDPEVAELALAYLAEREARTREERIATVPAEKLRAGLVLAQDLYDESGIFLARKGVRLTEEMVPRLLSVVPGSRIRVYGS
ncbi:MAG: response regulator [Planctomycetes bacterium]|nr:response regulator [Planctomycetota bacterium]